MYTGFSLSQARIGLGCLGRGVLWLVLPIVLACNVLTLFPTNAWVPRDQASMFTHTIYAYRQWQSVGLMLKRGEVAVIAAQGEWQYSPVAGRHGPNGLNYAPDFYPLPYANAGALLAKVGEAGEPFWVGEGITYYAETDGRLYFRINDDILGDNVGTVKLTIDVQSPTDESHR